MKEVKAYIADIHYPQTIMYPDGSYAQLCPGQMVTDPELALQAEAEEDRAGRWTKLGEQKMELLAHFDEIQEILKK